MQLKQILNDLDREILRLQQARTLLAGNHVTTPRSSPNYGKRKTGPPASGGKLSLEGRKRIGEAMKRSWALRKRQQAIAVKSAK
jgi:hypothetical protein